ncbi:MAG: hypothetical protein H6728_07515 [Myxococcales bacterium]|nr:hypothetical protein [Myxococcales bacterium]MCB9642909.1 hypothetical protein [Myxococcales bacterium]
MSGKNDDFKSFQIGSMPGFGPGAGLGSAARPAAPAAAPAAAPQGAQAPTNPEDRIFPVLEELIESGELESVGQSMAKTCEQLDELISKRTGRIQQEASKARKAYEHVFDLIDHLIQLKEEMLAPKEEG